MRLVLDVRAGVDFEGACFVRLGEDVLETILRGCVEVVFLVLVFVFCRTKVFFFLAFKKHRLGLQYAPSCVEGSHWLFRPNWSHGLERTWV